MNNPKWQVGPVKLVNGYDGNILLFCDHRKIYLGTYKVPDGGVHCIEWREDGTGYYGPNDHNLAPPPKKTMRVRFWVNVYTSSLWYTYLTKSGADSNAGLNRFACIEIDREVEEGEGLS